MAKETIFKKFTGEKIPNFEEYVKNVLVANPNTEIIVGTDSQNRGSRTYYSTVIAMYYKDKTGQGHGAHCIYSKWYVMRDKTSTKLPFERLTNEVVVSLQVADALTSAGISVEYIDIDINPDPEFESNKIYAALKGMVIGSGYKCRWKTLGPLITTMADYVVKH